MRVLSIYVWHGKAYLPAIAQDESGVFVVTDPVYIANLDPEELLAAAETVLSMGHPHVPRPTREEVHKRRDPVLTATKARSWKELARTGASYTADWTDREIRVDMSRLDKKGRWEYDPNKVRLFPPDTPLLEIVAVILEDIQSRPEVWQ